MRSRSILSLVVAGALTLSACGGDDDSAGTTDSTASTAAAAADVPERIVSLSPTATEMLFAIGAGDQVVAVDDQSDYPPDVPTTDLSGYEPNTEAIAGYEPDLVVASDNAIGAELDTLGIDLLALPAATTLDDAYTQIEQLGAVTGHVTEATGVVEGMKSDIEEILAEVPAGAEPLTYYHELDSTYFSVTSSTFIGQLYELAGLTSIADAADATVAAVERGAPGVYNVVDDEPATVATWLPYLAETLGAKKPMRVPVWLARMLAGFSPPLGRATWPGSSRCSRTTSCSSATAAARRRRWLGRSRAAAAWRTR